MEETEEKMKEEMKEEMKEGEGEGEMKKEMKEGEGGEGGERTCSKFFDKDRSTENTNEKEKLIRRKPKA